MADKKISKKVFLENLGDLTATYGEDMEQARKDILAGIEKANSDKAKKNAEKKAVEDAPIIDAILAVVGDELTVSADLTTKVNGALGGEEPLTTAKVVAVANALAKTGKIAVEKVIVDKGVRNAYKKV
jgi:hypothetical protein